MTRSGARISALGLQLRPGQILAWIDWLTVTPDLKMQLSPFSRSLPHSGDALTPADAFAFFDQ